jgi:hypothetical protein
MMQVFEQVTINEHSVGYRVVNTLRGGGKLTIETGISFKKALSCFNSQVEKMAYTPRGASVVEIVHNPTRTTVAVLKNCFNVGNILSKDVTIKTITGNSNSASDLADNDDTNTTTNSE